MSKRTANNPVFLWEDSGRPRPRQGFIHCLDLSAVVIFGQHHIFLGLIGRGKIGGRRKRGGRLLGQGLAAGRRPVHLWEGAVGSPQDSGSISSQSHSLAEHSQNLPQRWRLLAQASQPPLVPRGTAPTKPSGPERFERF